MPRAPKASGPTAKQLGLLHVGKRELGLTDSDYRAILNNIAGVESAGDLDRLGFEAVMSHLQHLGFAPALSKLSLGYRGGMATPAQVALIRKLWQEFCTDTDQDAETALNAWLTRFHGVSALRFVNAEKANKIIPGLRAMSKRHSDGH